MLTRRRFVEYSALTSAMWACRPRTWGQPEAAGRPLRLAILGSVYRHQSQMQMLADRFLVGYPWEGEWHKPNVQVVSVYVDQLERQADAAPSPYQLAMAGTRVAPASAAKGIAGGLGRDRTVKTQPAPDTTGSSRTADLSSSRAQQFGFRVCSNIPEALRCGGDRIAVDAVLTIAEQDDYPTNNRGQVLLPSYDFFQQCAQVFEEEKHALPYFNHKQLSYSFEQAQTMVNVATRLRFPLLAGSSLPLTWRLPHIEIPLGAQVEEALLVGVSTPDGIDFDALEALQCMLERRKGGETGVKAVQLIEGDDVWAAGRAGRWSSALLSAALSRSDTPMGLTVLDGRPQDLVASGVLPQLAKDPAAYCVEYTDGTRATLLLLNGAIMDYNFAANVEGHGIISTQFFLPPPPNQTANTCLAANIEQTFLTKTAAYPIERTLLATGILEACLHSKHNLNQRLETPHLSVSYQPPALAKEPAA